MTPDDLIEAVMQMPKVELHVHLEGATDAETVWEMARRNNVCLPAESLHDWKKHYRFKNFEHFIEIYTLAAATMCTPEDWVCMVKRFLARQSRQNIVYSEVMFSPSHQIGKLPWDEWIDAIVEGATEGEREYGSRVRLIADISRHLPNTQSATLECALLGMRKGYVIGLGLGGIEKGFPPDLFVETFEEAKRNELHLLAHAGETTGPETVRSSVDLLGVERIGHGIRCLEDAQLVEQLRLSRLPLEVCPTSNYCTGVVALSEPHPLQEMVGEGLFCTVNSDDPPMFGTSLVDEYALLFRQGVAWPVLRQLNLNAVEASFLAPERKRELRQQIVTTAC